MLSKKCDITQPYHTPFPVLNESVVSYPVLTTASQPASRFLRRQVRWLDNLISENFPQFVVSHTVRSFNVVNGADVFLELLGETPKSSQGSEFDLWFLCIF